jgi:hypothetical protein
VPLSFVTSLQESATVPGTNILEKQKITANQQAEIKTDLVLSFVLSLNSPLTVHPICTNAAKMFNVSDEFELFMQ